jgi:hypothetical protein
MWQPKQSSSSVILTDGGISIRANKEHPLNAHAQINVSISGM